MKAEELRRWCAESKAITFIRFAGSSSFVRRSRSAFAGAVLALGLSLGWSYDSEAQTAPASSAAGGGVAASTGEGGAAGAATESEQDSEATRVFAQTTALIEDFIAQRLDLNVEPATLFDIDISDARLVEIEEQRLSSLALTDAPTADSPATKKDAKAAQPRTKPGVGATAAPALDGAAGAPDPRLASPADMQARRNLDAARLEFYRLPRAQRERLLDAHRARQQEQTPAEAQLGEAEQKARAAEEERQAALEAARTARTEALRLVAEEHARLLAISQRQAEFEQVLLKSRRSLSQRKEAMLGWHRKVREAIDAAEGGQLDPKAVDAIYAELRTELRATRDRLAEALSDMRADSAVPQAGADRLSNLPGEVDRSSAGNQRKLVEKERERLAQLEQALRSARQREFYDDVVSLNRDRLALYPHLSRARRNEIVGFGPAGLDQAKAEVRQVLLVLRQHLQAADEFVGAMRAPGAARSDSAITATLLAFKWLVPIALFLIWRRRAERTLSALREASREERRRHRLVEPSRAERVLAFVMRVRKPLEWLALWGSIVWLLPPAAQATLEVALLTTVLGWTFGGAAVVATIDALAAQRETGSRESRLVTAHVRLRSLRLLGRVVVLVALVLSISERLVGRGTVYSWVLSTFGFAALPVLLLLAHWWHDIIHERLSQKRRKTAIDAWVVSHDLGWRRLPAALVGGALLLARGALRALRQRVSTFDLSRRVLAYLFRRDMNRRGETGHVDYGPLLGPIYEALGPETLSRDHVASIADDDIQRVIQHVRASGGGLFAVVGERGAGKTTVLARISREAGRVTSLDCPLGGEAALAEAMAQEMNSAPGTGLERSAALVDSGATAALLIDDAHRLILPRMGGLDEFDAVLAVARRHSDACAWVFAFDEVVWRFFERARGARPIFDDVVRLRPWREEAISRLLLSRTAQAGLVPTFDQLLSDLPTDADDLDIAEAVEKTSTGYYRLLWDYAGGNPGVALAVWRSCLGMSADGRAAVKVFEPPGTLDLETLPDSSVFVLRAVVQLELAHPDDIAQATMLEAPDIEDALRFGLNRGYFRKVDDRYWVTWLWFRPITRFLQRRYLLSGS